MSLVRFRFWALFFCLTENFVDEIFFYTKKDGLLAQAVEHLTFNQGVAGSSPAWLSNKAPVFRSFSFFV